ncbi:P-loop containing nucleoside triphosphate hydrolase protein [Absidia repens]|uniref:p-loop containing nucleoside triphosphate hydrolase protein n=1 Tax=Absidia repens TaxID=90262 RepID=A0A1X2I2T5_9FUNG|nr:P-loop containing nucleoside triphosphate hydrolase protein [Absidia repens]
MTEGYLDSLNEKQREAVVANAKYLQILAGPGSGKTRVLTTRVAHLVKYQKINPAQLMVATFTRKAAIEMKERLESENLLGPMQTNLLTMGTFHSICARYLRQYATSIRLPNDFRIIEPQETSKILLSLIDNELARKLSPQLERTKATATGFQAKISQAKNSGVDGEEFELIHCDNMLMSDLTLVFKAYDERLRMEHLVVKDTTQPRTDFNHLTFLLLA